VTVTYQSARTIRDSLAAMRRCYDEQLLDVVIVDNGSTDATRELLAREAGWVRMILCNRNIGFGRGCNVGFAQVTSPYTVFINPDAMVEPDAIRTLLTFMEQHPRVGIAGPAMYCGENGTEAVLQHTGDRETPWTILRNAMPVLGKRLKTWKITPGSPAARTGWVAGAVFMVRTQLMADLQGFDPRFFLYWEETDVCKRAEELGFETWAVGDAVARHIVGASTANEVTRLGTAIARHYLQSRYYYMVKHHGRLAATTAEIGEFALLVLRSLADAIRGRGLHRLYPRLQARLLSMPDRPTGEH
jgi:hypothetical protein